jgi:acyl-CoA reductase-like NAD-dependent aldehyde dehydrogenase
VFTSIEKRIFTSRLTTCLQVRNPANGDLVAHVAEGDKDDVEHALNIATEAFEDGRWSNKAPRERGRILTKAAQLLRDRLEYIIKIEVLSTGRAIKEMRAQIPRVAEWLEYFGAMAQTVEGGVTPFGGDFVNYYRRIPLGVVGLITPWNHPLLIAMKKVAPALAAGNCLVVKPSELAPIAVIELGKILHEAGVPPGVVNIVPGFGMGAGKALSDTPRIARLDITGGTVTGRVVAASAGRNLVPVAAELGTPSAPFAQVRAEW